MRLCFENGDSVGHSNMHTYFCVAGELAEWPSKRRLASLLRKAGLKITVGSYSIRVEGCSHFKFQEYGGDLGDPQIDADAPSLEEMHRDAQLVSDALTSAQLRHRFEIYHGNSREMVGYLHFAWPLDSHENTSSIGE